MKSPDTAWYGASALIGVSLLMKYSKEITSHLASRARAEVCDACITSYAISDLTTNPNSNASANAHARETTSSTCSVILLLQVSVRYCIPEMPGDPSLGAAPRHVSGSRRPALRLLSSPPVQDVLALYDSFSSPNPRLRVWLCQIGISIIAFFDSKIYSEAPHIEFRAILSAPPIHIQRAIKQHSQLPICIPARSASANSQVQLEL